MNTYTLTLLFSVIFSSFFLIPSSASAHRSGCHNLHTCPSDTNSYVCGDLGYPCDGSTSIHEISKDQVFVPLLVEKMFEEIFGRKPTEGESEYWKKRFRSDKDSLHKLRPAMAWHKANRLNSPTDKAKEKKKPDMVKDMNAMFASVYNGRVPTTSEHAYWISRIKDKPTPPAMIGAMHYHKIHNIQH